MHHCSVESVASFFNLTGRPAPAHPPVSLKSKATLQCRGRREQEEAEEEREEEEGGSNTTKCSVQQFISQQESLGLSTLSKGQINLELDAITVGASACVHNHAE